MIKKKANFVIWILNNALLRARVIIPERLRFPRMARIFIPWLLRYARVMPGIVRLTAAYIKSSIIRKEELKRGLQVPPFLIISITAKCNLKCAGCYAVATGTVCDHKENSLELEQWRKIIQQAKELGVFGFIIAGGEPFIIPNLLQLSEEFKDRLFLIFTNGTLLKEHDFERLRNRKLTNTIIVVSIEGDQEITNRRRGTGVYKKVISTIKHLDHVGIISGISVTINRTNFKYWMNEKNIDALIASGVRLGFFLEYIPVDNNTDLMLSNKERRKFRQMILTFRETKQIFLVHSPGDEELMRGCVSAGRGFAHITPSGDLTPCPVSNIATHNLLTSTLREGLKSPLFKIIRETEHLLETNGSPCALFAHPNEVEELTKKVYAYRTSV